MMKSIIWLFLVCLCSCATTRPTKHQAVYPSRVQLGMASWYGGRFDGRKTASGEVFSKHALTAAHRSLPLGTVVRVTNRDNGRFVTARINDRGPYRHDRIIDLSEAAARRIGMLGTGVAPVKIEILQTPPKY